MRPGPAVAPLATVLLLALPGLARAGTVHLEAVPGDDEAGTPTTYAAWFAAAPGEANALTMTLSGRTFTVTDTGAPLTAGAGCRATGANSATCAVPTGFAASLGHVDLGDRDDRASGPFDGTGGDGDDAIDASSSPFIVTRLEGGAGNDTLTVPPAGGLNQVVYGEDGDDTLSGGGLLAGGNGDDTVQGGAYADDLSGGAGRDVLHGAGGDDQLNGDEDAAPSPDVLDGGPGRDTIDYAEAREGVTVDLEAAVGGAPGEGDRLSGFEDIHGSGHADVLRGTDGPNTIFGGNVGPFDGGDRITGRGGADRILGTYGLADRVYGGSGPDDVDAGSGDHVTCDRGVDTARIDDDAPGPAPLLGRSCEKVHTNPSDMLSYRLLLPGAHGAAVMSFARRLGGCGGLVTLRGAARGTRLGPLLGEVRWFWKRRVRGEGRKLRFRLTAAGRRAARAHAEVTMRALSGAGCSSLKRRRGFVTEWRARL